MTSEQSRGQSTETKEFYNNREYICPECRESMFFMGTDFKAPKQTDIKAWDEAERFIKSGKVYYRGSQDEK
jgi:hypothetical protein